MHALIQRPSIIGEGMLISSVVAFLLEELFCLQVSSRSIDQPPLCNDTYDEYGVRWAQICRANHGRNMSWRSSVSGLLGSTRPTWGLLAEASRSARIVGAWTSILRHRSTARASTGRHSTLKAVCVGGLASRISASEWSFRNKFVHVPMSIKCLAWCIRMAFRSEPFEQHESYSSFILLTGVATGVARRRTGDSAKTGRHTSVNVCMYVYMSSVNFQSSYKSVSHPIYGITTLLLPFYSNL